MLYLAGDHLVIELVQAAEKYLRTHSIEFNNVGAQSGKQPVTLQTIIPAVAKPIQADPSHSGILICGTGAGVEIGANRFRGVRASLCVLPQQAVNSRQYDNANVICLGSWLTTEPGPILDAWFATKFDDDPARTQMIRDFDDWR